MEITLIDEIIETAVDVFAAAQKVIQAQPQDRVSQHEKCYRSHDTVWQCSQVNQTRDTEIQHIESYSGAEPGKATILKVN